VVYGNVKGNLRAKDRIEIKKDGRFNGDRTTSRIMIEDGAYFKGSSRSIRARKRKIRLECIARSAAPAGAAAKPRPLNFRPF